MTNQAINRVRQDLQIQLNCMKVGQCLDVSIQEFKDAFPITDFYPSNYDHFMSTQMGAAWGGWTLSMYLEKDIVTIQKHETSDQRTYIDPDRRAKLWATTNPIGNSNLFDRYMKKQLELPEKDRKQLLEGTWEVGKT